MTYPVEIAVDLPIGGGVARKDRLGPWWYTPGHERAGSRVDILVGIGKWLVGQRERLTQKQQDREHQREGTKTAQDDETKWVVGVDLCQRPS